MIRNLMIADGIGLHLPWVINLGLLIAVYGIVNLNEN